MILISHRGNISGKKPLLENSPSYIDSAINSGFDVEIDLWNSHDSTSLLLGHDFGEHSISAQWLIDRKDKLWIHCKNGSAFNFALGQRLRCFLHTDEDYVFTSNGFIWCYPGQPALDSAACIDVMPESNINVADFSTYQFKNFYGVCSDFIFEVKECLEM